MGVCLIVRMQLTWLGGQGAGQWWSGVIGRSRVPAAGSQQRQQEWGDASGPGLGGGSVPMVRSKGDRSRGGYRWCRHVRRGKSAAPIRASII